jgi:DNA-binding NarL/FixJ family response regulator
LPAHPAGWDACVILATNLDTTTASSVLWALALAREHGGAAAALAASGLDVPEVDRLGGAPGDLAELLGQSAGQESIREALALGLLAGRVAHQRPRARRLGDPTTFVVDRDLTVHSAEGQSILRLPWVDKDLFVGRRIPDISEIPSALRNLAVETCAAAFSGERRRFEFTSYGHTYSVDAVPVRSNGNDSIEAVLAIAMPVRSFASGAAAYERTAQRLDNFAARAEQAAERYRLAGRLDAEQAERRRASRVRLRAERARANGKLLRARDAAPGAHEPSVTSRQIEVLELASHGLTSSEIAEQLDVSVATVKAHFENVYARLGVGDRSAAVAAALRHGIIK